MRIQLLSDLHVEFEAFEPPPVDADVVVLAGDIHVGAEGVAWAIERFPDKPVVYVLGNHEYYGQPFHRLALELAERAAGTNVHVLERRSVMLGDVCFIGCTLWTDLALWGDPDSASLLVSECMSDYSVIRAGLDGQRELTPTETLGSHRRALKWLGTELSRQRTRKCVVVTHHGPSIRSIAPIDRDDELCCAYVSPLDEFVEGSGAALWVHGHVHESADYRIGGTRVVVNARGYPPVYSRSNPSFQPGLVLEI